MTWIMARQGRQGVILYIYLVYTKSVDSIVHALWLATETWNSNVIAIRLWANARDDNYYCNHWQEQACQKSSMLCYLTVLVYSKTTIHLSVSG